MALLSLASLEHQTTGLMFHRRGRFSRRSRYRCQSWLVWLSLDRLPGTELVMTQELIANMLGVRREGVTEAAGRLQVDGLIRYSRGHIKVLDRAKLEKCVCECYAVVKKEFDRLLPYKIHGLPNTTA
jgi:CRP-like cAMP-binding protein